MSSINCFGYNVFMLLADRTANALLWFTFDFNSGGLGILVRFFRSTAIAFFAGILFFSQTASAQTTPLQDMVGFPSSEISTRDINGVNLFTGQFDPQEPVVSIGPPSHMEFSRFWTIEGWRHNYNIQLIAPNLEDQQIYILDYGFGSDHFVRVSNGNYHSRMGNSLTESSVPNGGFVFTHKSGIKIILTSNGIGIDNTLNVIAIGTKIIKPNGEILSLKHETAENTTDYPSNTLIRLASVTSNRGYRLDFYYLSMVYNNSSSDMLRYWNWRNISLIRGFNMAVTACDEDLLRCPINAEGRDLFSRSIVGTNMTTNVVPKHFTESIQMSGGYSAVYQIEKASSSTAEGLYLTSVFQSGTPNIVKSLTYSLTLSTFFPPLGSPASMGRSAVSSLTIGERTYNYSYFYDFAPGRTSDYVSESIYMEAGSAIKTVVTDPAGATTTYFGDSSGKLYSVIDPLGRVTNFSYRSADNSDVIYPTITKTSLPELNMLTRRLDARLNVIDIEHTDKSQNQSNSIRSFASYPAICGNLLVCNKPTELTDALGSKTYFTYSADHGSVLTETGPANETGIRPMKRYSYTQRFAWLTNGDGSYSQASSPIWVLSEERTCISTATINGGCAGGATDEMVTTYDYGPDMGPNNLLVRGITVTSGGQTLRSCYGYDRWGNKISEIAPRAGLAVCP